MKVRWSIPLDKEQLLSAVDELLEHGIEGIAVSFLWSFKNNEHERLETAELEFDELVES